MPKSKGICSNTFSLYAVLLMCLALRAALAWHSRHVPADGDGSIYSAIAHSIADGRGVVRHYRAGGPLVPTAWGCPLYPAFLAFLYRFVSSAPVVVYMAQALVDTLTCLLVYRTVLICTKRTCPALLAAAGYAFYAPFVLMIRTFWADTLGYFCLGAAVYALVVAQKKGPRHFALAGVLLGIATLVKPMLLAFPVFLAIMLFLMRRQQRDLAAGAVVLVIASYLTIAPWTMRNYIVFHRFVPVASHGGQTLWGGTGPADGRTLTNWNARIDSKKLSLSNDPKVTDVSHPTYLKLKAFQKKLEGMDEISRNDALMAAAKQEIRQHPGRYASLAVKKFFRLWFHMFRDTYGSKVFLLIAAVNAILMLLAIHGSRGWKKPSLLPWTTLNLAIYTSIASMATFSHIRYSYPVFPFIIMLAAVGLLRLVRKDASWTDDEAERKPVSA